MMTAIVIDKGMLDALDKQLKWYRLERAELRDKCARLERENAELRLRLAAVEPAREGSDR
jgi:hypothetical protein